MEKDNVFLGIAVFIFIVAVVSLSVNYYNVSRSGGLTGFSVDTGVVNISVNAVVAINFTTDSINWGSGSVNQGANSATLISTGTVTGGSWSPVSQGFIVENIGNTNVTLDLAAGKTAAQFIGGTSPEYQWNISNYESGSCLAAVNSSLPLNEFYDVNVSSPGTRICDIFRFSDASDTIRIDLRLVVPSDSYTGALSDTLTLTYASA